TESVVMANIMNIRKVSALMTLRLASLFIVAGFVIDTSAIPGSQSQQKPWSAGPDTAPRRQASNIRLRQKSRPDRLRDGRTPRLTSTPSPAPGPNSLAD